MAEGILVCLALVCWGPGFLNESCLALACPVCHLVNEEHTWKTFMDVPLTLHVYCSPQYTYEKDDEGLLETS